MSRIRPMLQIALMTAVLCVLSPLALPVSLVPVTLGSFGVYLVGILLGWKKGAVCLLLYLLVGCIGLPVFAGGSGGLQVLAGPTGGYLLGYLPMVLAAGLCSPREGNRWLLLPGLLLGTALCYLLGTMWLSVGSGLPLSAAFSAGVLPFLPGDGLKMAGALFLGPLLKSRLQKAGVL